MPAAVVAAAHVVALCVGSVVLLARYAGKPPWEILYAEDGWVFLRGALEHSWGSVLHPYAGYLQLVPRLIAEGVSWLPLRDAAAGFAVIAALVAAGCAVFVFHASAGHVRTLVLRALLGIAVLALPTALIEITNSGVNTPWYLLFAAFWAILWRPRSWAGMAMAALVCFAAAASTTVAALYAPLVLARVIALPRVREHAVTAGWLVGCALQLPAVLESPSQLSHVATLRQAVAFYGHDVILPAGGWHLAWHLRLLTGNGWDVAIPAAVIAAAAAWTIIAAGTRARLFVVAALGLGFAIAVAGALVRWRVTILPVSLGWEPGSRYTDVPILLLDAAAVVAVDGYLGRCGIPLRGATATLALVAVLGAGWAADFRYPSNRDKGAPWPQIVDRAVHACRQHQLATVALPPLRTSVSCSVVDS
jgi:hypothetical protein